jgi:hypothetical protein
MLDINIVESRGLVLRLTTVYTTWVYSYTPFYTFHFLSLSISLPTLWYFDSPVPISKAAICKYTNAEAPTPRSNQINHYRVMCPPLLVAAEGPVLLLPANRSALAAQNSGLDWGYSANSTRRVYHDSQQALVR